jgi:hypothetical protein
MKLLCGTSRTLSLSHVLALSWLLLQGIFGTVEIHVAVGFSREYNSS